MTIQATRDARSAATKRRLLDATIEVLVERGYGGTSTLEVQQRAGVSRGALLHHYASRLELILAAVDHLSRERFAELPMTKDLAPKDNRTEWAIRCIWTTFEGPLFSAALELWLAARHDPALRAALIPQERMLGRGFHSVHAELFGEEMAAKPHFAAALEVLMDAMRGAAARSVLRTSASSDKLIQSWVLLMERYCD